MARKKNELIGAPRASAHDAYYVTNGKFMPLSHFFDFCSKIVAKKVAL